MLSKKPENKEVFESVSPMEHDAQESSTRRMEHQGESDPHPADEDVNMSPVAEEHHAEISHIGETGAQHSKLDIVHNSESDYDDSIQGNYEISKMGIVSVVRQSEIGTKDLFSESDSEEENEVATGGDQSTD